MYLSCLMRFSKILFSMFSGETDRYLLTFLLSPFLWTGVTAVVQLSGIFLNLLVILESLFKILLISLEVFWKNAVGRPFGPRDFVTSIWSTICWIVRFDISKLPDCAWSCTFTVEVHWSISPESSQIPVPLNTVRLPGASNWVIPPASSFLRLSFLVL